MVYCNKKYNAQSKQYSDKSCKTSKKCSKPILNNKEEAHMKKNYIYSTPFGIFIIYLLILFYHILQLNDRESLSLLINRFHSRKLCERVIFPCFYPKKSRNKRKFHERVTETKEWFYNTNISKCDEEMRKRILGNLNFVKISLLTDFHLTKKEKEYLEETFNNMISQCEFSEQETSL